MAELEHEEKRLLDSFRMHEMEVGTAENANDDKKLPNTLITNPEEQDEKKEARDFDQVNDDKMEKSLVKEEDVLGGTFGDPSKVKIHPLLESQVVDESEKKENINTEIKIKTELGPAFMNSSMQDKTPSTTGKDNPFHWEAPDVCGDNMNKLVCLLLHQNKIKQRLKDRKQEINTASEHRLHRNASSRESSFDEISRRTGLSSHSASRKLRVAFH